MTRIYLNITPTYFGPCRAFVAPGLFSLGMDCGQEFVLKPAKVLEGLVTFFGSKICSCTAICLNTFLVEDGTWNQAIMLERDRVNYFGLILKPHQISKPDSFLNFNSIRPQILFCT